MFDISENSKLIFKYFSRKYGQKVAPVGLLKCLSVISPTVNPYLPNLNVFHVTPTRQFKSRTSIEAIALFSKKQATDLGDDITMNSILNRFRNKKLGKRCVLINDGTTLFASKSKSAKNRLISGLSVLLSEGRWFYGDRQSPENILEGNVSVIMNMTLESYKMYESKLLGSTFLERFITVFYILPMVEMEEYMENQEARMRMRFKGKIKWKRNKVTNLEDYRKVLIEYAKRWSALSMKSFNGCFDQLISISRAHVALNSRKKIISEDLDFLRMIEPYLINPFASNVNRIITLYRQHKSYRDICLVLGKEYDKYKPYVSRVIEKARSRGIVE